MVSAFWTGETEDLMDIMKKALLSRDHPNEWIFREDIQLKLSPRIQSLNLACLIMFVTEKMDEFLKDSCDQFEARTHLCIIAGDIMFRGISPNPCPLRNGSSLAPRISQYFNDIFNPSMPEYCDHEEEPMQEDITSYLFNEF